MKANFVGREMFKKQSKRFLTMALCAGMALSNLGGVTAFAAGDSNDGSQTETAVKAKTINVGANAMTIEEDGWTKSDGQYLYFGSYDGTPVKYRVLDRHDGTGNATFSDGSSTMKISGGVTGDYLLLDSDAPLYTHQYTENSPNTPYYSQSESYSSLKSGLLPDNKSLFSDKELSAIAKTDLAASPAIYQCAYYQIQDEALTDNISFLLSGRELQQLYHYENNKRKSSPYPMRSTYTVRDNPATFGVTVIVNKGAYAATYVVKEDKETLQKTYYSINLAPASNLDLSKVLFTSSKDSNKKSELAKIARTPDSEWKVTLRDATKSVKVNGTVTREDQTITVPYKNTSTSTVDQISIVLTSGDINAKDTTVLYYGKLAAGTSSEGTATFTLPSGLPKGSKAYILAEEIKEWTWTDYASEPVEITIPNSETPEPEPEPEVTKTYTVTFDSMGGTALDNQTVDEYGTVTKPEAPTKDGSVFAGWYTDEAGTVAYDFASEVTSDFTLYAKWSAAPTSSIENYDSTNTETSGDENKQDFKQQNVQDSDDYSDSNGFLLKSVEWTDKAAGKARITISTKNTDVTPQHGAVYAFTKCTAHGFSSEIAAKNVKFLVEQFGSVDLVVPDGSQEKDITIIENVTSTDLNEIQNMLEEKIAFDIDGHYTVALYMAMCRYFSSHEPYVVYVSFDTGTLDAGSETPDNFTTSSYYNIWSKLVSYENAGRYFSMGQENVNTHKPLDVGKMPTYRVDRSIMGGLAKPTVFNGMDQMTTSDMGEVDLAYTQSFADLAASGAKVVPDGFTIKDEVSDKFTIENITANSTGITTNSDYQTSNKVEVAFSNIEAGTVAEVYIDIVLNDKNDGTFLGNWSDTNVGNATVTYTDENGKEQTKSVESPELCYTKTYKIDTECVNGTITDPIQVNPGEKNKTVAYAPKEGYKLKSVTVDGKPVDIKTYPDSYTFGGDDDADGINEDHKIVVEYEKTLNITTTVTNGTISECQTVTEGSDSKEITFKANDGYTLKSIVINPGTDNEKTIYSSETGTGEALTSYTFKKVTEDQEIAVVYEKTPAEDQVQVTTTVTGGTISGATTWKKANAETGVAEFRSLVSYKPNNGYRLKSVKVTDNDGKVTEVDITKFPSEYPVDNSGNWKVDVVFEPIPPQYQILTSVYNEVGGTITEKQTVDEGKDSETVTWTPNDGYRVKTVTVDGEPINLTDYPNGYTFTNVTDNHTVQVEFEEIPDYTITTGVTHGSITTTVDGGEPSTAVSSKVPEGGSATVTYKPEDGYRLKSVIVTDKDGNKTDVTGTNPESYTFTGVQTDWSIEVIYEPIPEYTIDTDVTGGTITPTAKVTEHGSKTVEYQPDEGYVLKSVTVDNEPVDINTYPNSYTFTDVTEYHSIDVVYARQYKITTTVENGEITEDQLVWEGEKATISYSPKDGYVLKSVKVNGKDVDLTDFKDGYTFDVVNENATVDVVYARQYKITTTVENGTIDPSQVVYDNDKTTINYSPKDGYVLKSVKINGKEVDITKFPNSYTFENLDGDATIEVVYAKTESLPKDKLTIETSVKNGTITPSVSVNKGDDMTVTYKAKDGYKLSKVIIDGKEVDITKYPTGYTFKSVSANHTIKVVFVKATGIAAKTGDTMAPIAAVSVICLAAAAGAIALVLVRRKRNA